MRTGIPVLSPIAGSAECGRAQQARFGVTVDEKPLVDDAAACDGVGPAALVVEIDAVVGRAMHHVIRHDDAVDRDVLDHRLHEHLVLGLPVMDCMTRVMASVTSPGLAPLTCCRLRKAPAIDSLAPSSINALLRTASFAPWNWSRIRCRIRGLEACHPGSRKVAVGHGGLREPALEGLQGFRLAAECEQPGVRGIMRRAGFRHGRAVIQGRGRQGA